MKRPSKSLFTIVKTNYNNGRKMILALFFLYPVELRPHVHKSKNIGTQWVLVSACIVNIADSKIELEMQFRRTR